MPRGALMKKLVVYVYPYGKYRRDPFSDSPRLAEWVKKNGLKVETHYFDGNIEEWFGPGVVLDRDAVRIICAESGIDCSLVELGLLCKARGDVLAFRHDSLIVPAGTMGPEALLPAIEALAAR